MRRALEASLHRQLLEQLPLCDFAGTFGGDNEMPSGFGFQPCDGFPRGDLGIEEFRPPLGDALARPPPLRQQLHRYFTRAVALSEHNSGTHLSSYFGRLQSLLTLGK